MAIQLSSKGYQQIFLKVVRNDITVLLENSKENGIDEEDLRFYFFV